MSSSNPQLEKIQRIIKPHEKVAWIPKIYEGANSSHISSFSGIALLRDTEEWPCCKSCSQPMQLFLQVSSKELPVPANDAFGEGILQVFYCTNKESECETECETFLPFSKSTYIRVIKFTESVFVPEKSPVKNEYPTKQIVGWESQSDYPNWEELEELGVSLMEQEYELLSELDYPKSGDKLLGWPHWVQGIEYPNCPDCGSRMKLVFQIDSENNLPHMFGDVGCSHITQCETHVECLAIAWACG